MVRKSNRIKDSVLILIGINVFVFMLQQFIPGFNDNFMLYGADILQRPWMILTSMFMHADLIHLMFNMYALLIFGPLIQRAIGVKRFVGAYLISGVFAGLMYAILQPANYALGASGAVMAVIGMVIMLFPDLKVLMFFVIPMSMRTAGIIFAALDIFGLVSSASGIAHIAHLAGLGAGLGYGFYLIRKSVKGTIGKLKDKNSKFFRSDPTDKGEMHIPTQEELDNFYKDR